MTQPFQFWLFSHEKWKYMLIKKTMYKDMWMKNVSAISVNRGCCRCQPVWLPPTSTVSPEGAQGSDKQAALVTRVSATAAVSKGGPQVLAPPLLLFFSAFIYLFFFLSFIYISWRLITLQYCSSFCHTLIWISHEFTCDSMGEGERGMIWENSIETCTLSIVEHCQSRFDAWDKCSGLVH